MEKVNLSILVVNCKDYKPSHNWYLCKSERCFYGTAKTPDIIDYDETRLHELEDSDDCILMPECPGMKDEDAAEVIKEWCVRNDIPYHDDMDDIEATYRWYYRFDDGQPAVSQTHKYLGHKVRS